MFTQKDNLLVNKKRIPNIIWILLFALVLRLLHLASSVSNPVTYYPGADEVFYIEFGQNIINGQFGLNQTFIFMDPLYGYLLGALNWIFGDNLFVVYLFQVFIDVITIWLIYLITIKLWDHRAALIASIFYALSTTAIFYTTTILKPTLVANFIALWIFLTIYIIDTNKAWLIFIYGIFLGIGISLRSNLLLLTLSSILIISLLYFIKSNNKDLVIKLLITFLGLSLPLSLLAYRNYYISGSWSFLPPNGGIVLHQLYNDKNPDSLQFTPEFVSYRRPYDILKGYISEAERKSGSSLNQYEASEFWRKQAFEFIKENPNLVLKNILRKAKEFTSYKEKGNSRLINQEESFLPVIDFLPKTFGILFVFGLPGIILLFIRDRYRSLPLIFALLTVFLTFIVFIATSRFRMHGVPVLAIGSGIFITSFIDEGLNNLKSTVSKIVIVISLGLFSLWTGNKIKDDEINYMNFAWGYLKMGELEKAKYFLSLQLEHNSTSTGPYELLGIIALNDKRFDEAIIFFTRVLEFAPNNHVTKYNLALSLSELNRYDESLDIIESAISDSAEPDYYYLKGEIHQHMGNINSAIESYKTIITIINDSNNENGYINKVNQRLKNLTK